MQVNHLLFRDNLKLLVNDEGALYNLLWVIEEFFAVIGLELNANKSARTEAFGAVSSELQKIPITNEQKGYKCLNVIQHQKTLQHSNKKRLIEELHDMSAKICWD